MHELALKYLQKISRNISKNFSKAIVLAVLKKLYEWWKRKKSIWPLKTDSPKQVISTKHVQLKRLLEEIDNIAILIYEKTTCGREVSLLYCHSTCLVVSTRFVSLIILWVGEYKLWFSQSLSATCACLPLYNWYVKGMNYSIIITRDRSLISKASFL